MDCKYCGQRSAICGMEYCGKVCQDMHQAELVKEQQAEIERLRNELERLMDVVCFEDRQSIERV